jgi:hypothetical protein
MIRKILAVLITTAMTGSFCFAQAEHTQSITNWGAPFYDVQLSIGATNQNLLAGSTNVLFVRIKNSSTNSIYIAGVNPVFTTLFLTNNLGKSYRLTPDIFRSGHYISAPANFPLYNYKVNAGDTYENSMPLVIGNDIPPGDFYLEAIQHFTSTENGNIQKVESNLLEVKIE